MNRRANLPVATAMPLALVAACLGCHPARGAETAVGAQFMSAAQQNAVLQKYCGGCHSDALQYGGLSVEHFDAAHPEPGVAAMLVSKLTSGLTPGDVESASRSSDPDRKTRAMMLRGAMGASGSMPDESTQIAFARALSAEASGAEEWHFRRNNESAGASGRVTADIVRQLASTAFPGKTDMYRLILSCRVDTHEGEIRLAWANGVPEEGQPILVAVDGRPPFTHKAEGGQKQGNGANGPGATILYPDRDIILPFPGQSLAVSNVFPNETVVFPFGELNAEVRRELSACFSPAAPAR